MPIGMCVEQLDADVPQGKNPDGLADWGSMPSRHRCDIVEATSFAPPPPPPPLPSSSAPTAGLQRGRRLTTDALRRGAAPRTSHAPPTDGVQHTKRHEDGDR